MKALEERLGHHFRDPALLARALTHRSSGARNNERLEFLGDSVLGLVAAAELYRRFPEADEGQLSRLRARMVRQETLAEIARELQLGACLQLGGGERKSGAETRASILSDALEAVMGAILLDAGYKKAAQVVAGWLETRLNAISPEDSHKDPKTRLQERLHTLGRPLPEYTLLNAEGRLPSEEFEVECRVAGLGLARRAKGAAVRAAEQAAAALLLRELDA